MQRDIVIFGFLGSLPTNNNLDNWSHWKKFFNTTNTHKSKVKILIHPFDINDNDRNTKSIEDFKGIGSPDILIVSKENHVLTEWGTNSLADATLLMMQESIKAYPNTLKKFILLSPSCCPIFNFDFIYEEITQDNKSWIHGNDLEKLYGKNVDTNFKFFKDDDYRKNDKRYSLYFSNWMILDINHINLFFLSDNKDKTYIKSKTEDKKNEIYKCKFEKDNERIILNPNFESDKNYKKLYDFKTFFTKPWFANNSEINGINVNYCWPIEEIIFGNWILKYIIDSEKNISDELKFISIDFIKNQININKKFYNKLNKIYKDFSDFNSVEPVKNNDVRGNFVKIGFKKLPIGTEYPYLNNSKLRLVSSTYINWTEVSIDPHNILRNFKLKEINFQPVNTKKTIEETLGDKQISFLKWNNININEFLDSDNTNIALKKLTDADDQLKELKIKKLINNEMAMTRSLTVLPLIPSTWHPLEFSSWNLKNMVNAFLLMNYFKKVFIENEYLVKEIFNFKEAYETYRTIILENGIEIKKIVHDDVLLEIPIVTNEDLEREQFRSKYENNNFGTIVNPDTLLKARSANNLFIRKCNNNSKINLYSDILFEDPNVDMKKTITKTLNKNLKNYGIDFQNFDEFIKKINEIRTITFNNDGSNNEESTKTLQCFILKNISLLKTFNIDGKIYYKFNLPKNIIIERVSELGKGAWNVAYTGKIIKGVIGKNKYVVLRTMYNNPDYRPARINSRTTQLSFFDNLIGIILTILQKKVFNYKICNDVYLLSYDTSIKLNELGNLDDISSNPLYVTSVNEMVDGTTLDYLKENFSFDTFKIIFYQIVIKLNLLQTKLKFMHGDLKLDNVFYKIVNDKLQVLLSDLGNSTLTLDGNKISGNPQFVVTGMDNEIPYYGKDILYFLINALGEINNLDVEKYPDKLEIENNIITMLKSLFNIQNENEIYNWTNFTNIDGKKYKSSKIFSIDHRYSELNASSVKQKLEILYPEVKSDSKFTNILTFNNFTYFSKYHKYKSKYLKLKKNINTLYGN